MNSKSRNDEGATLAFVAAAAIIIIIVGVAFFFLTRMLGGGRELQSATDSGNLNVAKQAPFTPTADVSSVPGGARVVREFGGLLDSTGHINLESYNRLVGKALLVALNAKEEGTPQSAANARKVISYVQGPDSVGQALAAQLSNSSNTSGLFTNLANANSVRMLRNTATSANTSDFDVAWMRKNCGAASNLTLVANSAANVSSFISSGACVTGPNSTRFVAGYTPINFSFADGTSASLQSVPMRPGQPPHLVSLDEFKQEATPPAGLGVGIPPNAFESGGASLEGFKTSKDMATRSAAIVGSPNLALNQGVFNASIPHGVIVVANDGGTIPGDPANSCSAGLSGTVSGSSNSTFSSNLMTGVGIKGYPPSGPWNAAVGSVPAAPSPPSVPAGQTPPSPVTSWCDSSTYYTDSNCISAHGPIDSVAGADNTTTGGTANNMMAVEAVKLALVNLRTSSMDSVGCVSVPVGTGGCTPLKKYAATYPGLGTVGSSSFPVSTSATLWDLLQQNSSYGGPTAVSQIEERMLQMHPDGNTTSNVDNALKNLTITFGQGASFLFFDTASNSYKIYQPGGSGTDPRSWLEQTSAPYIADGAQVQGGRDIAANNPGTDTGSGGGDPLVDSDGDGGWPHPFDCEPGQCKSSDRSYWVPGTGEGNLLGTLDFRNSATVPSGKWCCPC